MVADVFVGWMSGRTGAEAPDAGLVGGAGEPVDLFADGDDELAELAWQERALCAQTDPEAFFPEKGGSTREAKKVCLGCEVRGDCLEYALAHDERFGIWGGLSERERRRLKKEAV
jgi:WhiB family transcriptional regulator, redox-sensing transcriptional regulator